MNDIINTILLAGDKFMPEMHLRQPRFTYSVCVPFTKNKERIQKFKEIGHTKYIYRNELDKACFQNNMAYGNFKNLARRTAADKVLRDQAINISKYDGNMMDIKGDWLLWFINILIKRLQAVILNLCPKMSVLWTWLCNNWLKSFITPFKKMKIIFNIQRKNLGC